MLSFHLYTNLHSKIGHGGRKRLPAYVGACGCPVITSSVSSLPEIGNDAALYCNPNDEEAVARLTEKVISNQVFARELAQKGKKRALQFHPEGRTHALMSFYQSILHHE